METFGCHPVNGVTVLLGIVVVRRSVPVLGIENLYNITLCMYSVNKLVSLSGSVCLIAVATYNNFSKLIWAHEPLSVLVTPYRYHAVCSSVHHIS